LLLLLLLPLLLLLLLLLSYLLSCRTTTHLSVFVYDIVPNLAISLAVANSYMDVDIFVE
jgi:hypothetical protein